MDDLTSYYGREDPATLDIERYFLAGSFICGVGYGQFRFIFLLLCHSEPLHFSLTGIQIVLYVTCALYLWSLRKQRRKSSYLLAYITVLIILETITVAMTAHAVQMNWIDNQNYPGGPWQYFLDMQGLPSNVMFYAFLFVVTFLSDILVVSNIHSISSLSLEPFC